jgi:alcohol dehydrogenase class IV
MLPPYTFELAPRIHYGPGAARLAGDALRDLCVHRVLLVSDPGVVLAGATESVTESLRAAWLSHVVFSDVRTNPDDRSVEQGVGLYRSSGCDGVIGVGGGSALDVAKAITTVVGGGGSIIDYEQGARPVPRVRPPLVLAPSTSGTGSEAVSGAIITDTRRMLKVLVVCAPADIALCDPLLAATLPAEPTAACGIDALAHAIGAYVSSERQPLADAMALYAISTIHRSLPRAVDNGADLRAREAMMVGSLTAGISMKGGGAVDHAFAHAVNVLFGVHHGVGVAQFLAAGMELNLTCLPERFADIAHALGVSDVDADPLTAGSRGIEEIRRFIAALPLPSLADLGIGEAQVEPIVEKVMVDDFHLGLNPVPLSVDDAIRVTTGAVREGTYELVTRRMV